MSCEGSEQSMILTQLSITLNSQTIEQSEPAVIMVPG